VRGILIALAAVAATLALSVGAGLASANNLSVDDQDFDIRIRTLNYVTPLGPISCSVTLLGSFHTQTVRKSFKTLIGHIDHASVEDATCTNAPSDGATIQQASLPWHVQYDSFVGRLPAIERITLLLVGAGFIIDKGSTECLTRTTATEPAKGEIIRNTATGQTGTLVADPDATIDATDTTGTLCDLGNVRGAFEGTGVIEDLAGNLLFIRLI